jgi:hypothetical protein
MKRLDRLVLALSLVLLAAVPAGATIRGDRYELQARLSMHNGFHHDGTDDMYFVQQRNELRFDLKYNLIPYGENYGPIAGVRFNMLYRARYDSIFDVRDSYRRRNYDRDDFRFPEGKYPREVFLDIDFVNPLQKLSVRIGRQQVVWGEADVFRSIDVVNPLRLDQNGLIGEDFSDFREPLWIVKFLYDAGSLGPITNAGIEWFYSPNNRPVTHRAILGEAFRYGIDNNNKVDGLRRQNSQPFKRVRHPWEITRVGNNYADATDTADLGPLLGQSDFVYLASRNVPTSEFDVRDCSMAGIRFLGSTFAGINFTLNYLFKRAELPGTALQGDALFDPTLFPNTGLPNPRADLLLQAGLAAATPDLDGDGIADGTEALARRCIDEKEALFLLTDLHGSGNPQTGCQPIAFWYPWTHIVGATFTYNDYEWTGAVFRMEQSFSTKEPRNGVPPLAGPRAGDFPRQRDFDTNGIRTTEVWRSMIGFDYLRSIGWTAARRWPLPWRSLFGQDQWLISGQFFNEYYSHWRNQIGLTDSITDRQHQWNPIFTTVLTGFFMSNRLRPFVSFAYEVNHDTPILWLQAEYNLGARWALRVGEILYMGSTRSESPLLLHRYADRDTLFMRLTYYLI